MTKNNQARILFVNDDNEWFNRLSDLLVSDGFCAHRVSSDREWINHILDVNCHDLVVIDLKGPIVAAIDILRKIRHHRDIPVVILTCKNDDIDRILALELGADDCLGKPFNPREFMARLKAVLRRSKIDSYGVNSEGYSRNGFLINTVTQELILANKKISLTAVECKLLELLIQSPGKTLTKEQLCEEVLHRKYLNSDRSIDVHVSRIRHKLEGLEGGEGRIMIKSIRGHGYQLVYNVNTLN